MNKYVCAFFVIMLSLNSILMGAEVGNLNEFKSVKVVSGAIQLTFQDQGGRFFWQIGDGEEKLEEYGEVVNVPIDQKAQFVGKGYVITFTPLVGTPGSFTINKLTDLRSVGGGLINKSFVFSVQSGVIVYGNVSE